MAEKDQEYIDHDSGYEGPESLSIHKKKCLENDLFLFWRVRASIETRLWWDGCNSLLVQSVLLFGPDNG